jgi:glyoxylase-like metal-dependent hydrolase (beta-lactamase superfamily II)
MCPIETHDPQTGGGVVTWSVGIIEIGVLPGCPLSSYVWGARDDLLLDVPCYCWLLRDAHTSVLVDTGPDTAASEDVGYEVAGDTRVSLLQGLRARGVAPANVTMIVHTHLHQDHIQNDALFPNAEVVVQRRELEAARVAEAACRGLSLSDRAAIAAGPYARSQEAGIWYIGTAEIEAQLGERLRIVEGEVEILPGITVTPSGGHTAGHQSVLVSTKEGTACIAGDIVSLSVNADVIGPMTPDAAATRAFLERVRASSWELIPSHDPAMRDHRWYVVAERR